MPQPRPVVALVRTRDPGDRAAADAVDEVLGLLGSPLDALEPGMRVLIKPNMFQLKPGFRSSPAILLALARIAAGRGAKVYVGERTRVLHQVLEGSEIHRYAEVVSFDDRPVRLTQIEDATSLRVPVAVPDIVLDCDYFIGVPQLRTHSSVVLTNAMKNLVGLLPGYTTRIVHMAGVEESIVDLNVMRPQHLVVSDATTVIEGNYPMAGESRPVGFIAAATGGPVGAAAVDTVTARIAGVSPDELDYLRYARERGLAPAGPHDIELRGTPPHELAFRIRRAPSRIVPPREGIHIHAETGCPGCRRFIAAALNRLHDELLAFPGELTVVCGPRETLPPLRGAVVLVGNALYDHREAGVYLEGCPPRAIQTAGFRYAMGIPVTPPERTQFRVPGQGGLAHLSQPAPEELV
jgi:uncharacterized protein (DUF362 family)